MRNLIIIAALVLASCNKEESINCYTISKVTDHSNIDAYDTYYTSEGRIFDHYPGQYEVGDIVCSDEIEQYSR